MRFFSFLLCLPLFFQVYAADREIDKYVKLSRLVRHDPRNLPEREEERVHDLTRKIMASVRDYGSAQNLDILVAKFVSSALSLDPATHQIYDSKKTSLSGHSTDKVFFVKDRQGTLRFIVKVFASPDLPSGKFLPELSGIALLQKLQLPHVEPVAPIAVGKCLCGQERYGLLLESSSPGKRCDMLVLACKWRDEYRSGRLQKLERMFAQIGTGLKELHDEKDGHSFLHGDAHLQNIFYDESREKIVLIDLARLHHSVDILGKPIASGRYDILRLRASLKQCAEGVLSEQETARFLQIFMDAYQSIR